MRDIGEDLGEDLGDTPANTSVGALVLASAALVLMDRKRKQEIRETMSMLQVIRWGSHKCPAGIPASCDHQRSSVVITTPPSQDLTGSADAAHRLVKDDAETDDAARPRQTPRQTPRGGGDGGDTGRGAVPPGAIGALRSRAYHKLDDRGA